jgi:predicted transcriptional regulator
MHKSLLDRKMNAHLTEQVRDVNKKYADKVLTHNRQIAKIKERLSMEGGTLSSKKNILASLKDSLDMRVRKLKANEENYKREVMSQLELEKQSEIEIAVKKRSVEIRGKLKRNFDNRLKLELRAKEAEFDKRKSELALEIQEKAKVLFD